MVGNVAFLIKDVVLLAVSFYLLEQDLDSGGINPEICSCRRRRTRNIMRHTKETRVLFILLGAAAILAG